MEVFRAVLEAVDHERNCARSYRLQAGRDLFGDWMVEIVFGRIGTRGRLIRYYADDESGAKKLVREKLRDRGSSVSRIGVTYRIRELLDPDDWLCDDLTSRSRGGSGQGAFVGHTREQELSRNRVPN